VAKRKRQGIAQKGEQEQLESSQGGESILKETQDTQPVRGRNVQTKEQSEEKGSRYAGKKQLTRKNKR